MKDQITAQTWRDLLLTAAQALEMEHVEHNWLEEHGLSDDILNTAGIDSMLLQIARTKFPTAKAAGQFAHIPVPPGNPEVDQWERLCAGGWTRQLVWVNFDGEDLGIDVEVAGEQDTSGDFTRSVTLWDLDGDRSRLTAEQARRLAANLQAAADLMDRLDHDGLTKREQIAQLQRWADEADAAANINGGIRDGGAR
jgi:hypothetical protein